MLWFQVPLHFTSDVPVKMQAQVRECPDCHGREWYVWRVLGLERQYLQCATCDRIETADGLPCGYVGEYAVALTAGDEVIHPLTVPGKEVTP